MVWVKLFDWNNLLDIASLGGIIVPCDETGWPNAKGRGGEMISIELGWYLANHVTHTDIVIVDSVLITGSILEYCGSPVYCKFESSKNDFVYI